MNLRKDLPALEFLEEGEVPLQILLRTDSLSGKQLLESYESYFLLTLFQSRSTSDLTGFSALREVPVAPDCLAVPHLPVPCHYAGLRRLAVLRFYVFDGGYGSLLRPCRVLLAAQDHLSGF